MIEGAAFSERSNARVAATLYREGLSRQMNATCAAIARAGDRLKTDGGPVCTVLEPRFIDGASYDALRAELRVVVEAISAIASRDAARQGAIQAQYLTVANEARLPLFSRLDGLIDDGGFKLIEFNALFHDLIPYGVGIVDEIHEVFAAFPMMEEVGRHFSIRPSTTLPATFASMGHLRAPRSRAQGATLALIDTSRDGAHMPIDPDFDYGLKLAWYLAGRGVELFYARASELEYAGGSLRAGDREIDFVLPAGGDGVLERGIGVLELGEDHPLMRALADGVVATCDAFPLGSLLCVKSLLARVLERAAAGEFAPEVAEAVTRVIPWTARVREGGTTYRGRARDIRELLHVEREELVLKPSFGFGGAGVYLGWDCSVGEWTRLIEMALQREDYLVQARVRVQPEEVWVYRDGAATQRTFRSDFCPYVWADGSVDGCMLRISENDRLNITGGATIRPLVVIDGRT